MPDAVLCIYTLPSREEARRRGFVRAWGEERAFSFWESLHRDIFRENRSNPAWDLVVMTSREGMGSAFRRLLPEGTRLERAPGGGKWGLGEAFRKLSRRYRHVLIAAGDLPGLTRDRVERVFLALRQGAGAAFLRERHNRFSAIGFSPWDPALLALDPEGEGRFWEFLGILEARGVQVYWEEERLDDLPGPEWVVPVLGYASRPLLPSMEAWPVEAPPGPELVLIGRLPSAGRVKTGLAEELAALPGGPDRERAEALAAAIYRAILFDRMDVHRGRPGYRCVGAFPFQDCARPELVGFPELFHPLPEVGTMETWIRDALCDLDEGVPRVACASDVPCLPEEVLERAFSALEEAQVVLGPSHDGDYNLVGMSVFHDLFRPGLFETGRALEQARRFLASRGIPYYVLAHPLRDLSTLEDLAWFREHTTLDQAPRLRRLLDRISRELPLLQGGGKGKRAGREVGPRGI